MEVREFDALRQEFDEHETELLRVKKTEYANDADRLSNFREVSLWVGLSPEEYCLILIMKHIHSIRRSIASGDYRWTWASDVGEGLKQRIADARNYLLLLAALIEKRCQGEVATGGAGTIAEKDDERRCQAAHVMTENMTGQHAAERPAWDTYFLSIAKVVASRSTCPRASVGAIIAKDNRIVSTGYNGSPSGKPHCTDVGCLMINGHCERAIHAETNAIAQAARMGLAVDGATMYYWDSLSRPAGSCIKCSQVMIGAGIIRLVSANGEEDLDWINRGYGSAR